jgi:hypothetical protein
MMESLREIFFKISRIHYSMFIGFLFDQPGCPLAGGRALMKLQKLGLVLFRAPLQFVGWVELTPSYVGFRCTQPNLHFAGVFARCETQQQPISEPSHNSFFFDYTGRSRPETALKPLMKHQSEPQNIEYRTAECQKSPRPPLEKGEFQVESLRSVIFL